MRAMERVATGAQSGCRGRGARRGEAIGRSRGQGSWDCHGGGGRDNGGNGGLGPNTGDVSCRGLTYTSTRWIAGQMGNNPSSQQSAIHQQPRPPPSRRTSSNIVRAQRKRSLELPEFQALTQSNHPPPPSDAIDIPMAAAVFQQPPSPPHSKAHYLHPSSTMIHQRQPYPPVLDPPQHHQSQPQPPPQHSHQSAHQQSQRPSSRSSKPAVSREDALVVRSRLPSGLPTPPRQDEQDSDQAAEGTQVATITWRGSAKEVYLTGISDSDRPYRVKMVHE